MIAASRTERIVGEAEDRRGHPFGIARLVGRDRALGKGALDQRQPRRNHRLAHRRVLVDLRREGDRREPVEPGRREPDVGGGDGGRHVLDRDAPVERHPLGDAELGGQCPQLVLEIAAAVQVEADVEVGPLLATRATARTVTSSSYVGVSAPV